MKVAKTYSLLEEQRRLAKQKVLSATGALCKRGMEIAVDVHTGSLRKGIEGYTRNGDVHLIMMRASRGLPIMRLLRKTIGLFGMFKRPSFSPVLLLHPDQGVAHS